MKETTLGQLYAKELETEVAATKKCIERIPLDLYSYKPHERSMSLGNLTKLVADIPKWITLAIKDGVVDFATYEHFQPNSPGELVKHFEENVKDAKAVLENITDEALEEMFYLKNNGQELMRDTKKDTISSSINHLVHHRGQLTVYMRLNDIAVPSIYGPSADDPTF